MQNEFKTFRIRDIATVVGGGTPSTSDSDNYGGDISWITPKDLSKHKSRYISHGERSLTNKGLKDSSATLLPKKTILFSSRAPIGYIAIAKKEVTTSQGFKSLILNDENHPEFFYYLLKTYTPLIESYATGSTFKEISGGALKNIEVSIPTLNTQKVIAHILGGLDDKIELNQKMNQTLEDIVKAIFKSWFVDFDPIRAKLEGKPTGLPDEISALYPSEFEESEIGSIPKGWDFKKLDHLLSKFSTGLNPRKNFKLGEGNNYYVTIKNLGELSVVLDDKCDRVTDDAINKINSRSNLEKEDILFSGIGTIGKVNFIFNKPKNWNISESVFTLRADEKITNPYFLFLTLKSQRLQNYVQANSSGSVQKGIRMSALNAYKLVIPSKKINDLFATIGSCIFNKISQNLDEIEKLTELKNTLLPKLISGELQIPDSKKFLEEVGIF
jgi:type I restriction enzyme S subunit